LSGELRRVNQLERRLLEAHRLGFKRAIIPMSAEIRLKDLNGMELKRAETIQEAIRLCFGESRGRSAGSPPGPGPR
jgi:DNA repair protein RadA/Sms